MSANDIFLTLHNGQVVDRARLPALSFPKFRESVLAATFGGWRVPAFFGHNPPGGSGVELYAVLADQVMGQFRVTRTRLDSDEFESLTEDCPQVHLFEREIAEQFGVRPAGHPWFKPVRFINSWRPGHDAWGRPAGEKPTAGVMDWYRVEGEEIHEVAVGPVHAGVIEPGAFRFQCHGEHVFTWRWRWATSTVASRRR
jgi:hypothetical protein